MNDNLFSEDWAVVGMVDPDANTAATYLTAAIDMTDWEQLAVITMVGTLGAAATVVTTVTASATSGGTYATVTGKTTSHALTSPKVVLTRRRSSTCVLVKSPATSVM